MAMSDTRTHVAHGSLVNLRCPLRDVLTACEPIPHWVLLLRELESLRASKRWRSETERWQSVSSTLSTTSEILNLLPRARSSLQTLTHRPTLNSANLARARVFFEYGMVRPPLRLNIESSSLHARFERRHKLCNPHDVPSSAPVPTKDSPQPTSNSPSSFALAASACFISASTSGARSGSHPRRAYSTSKSRASARTLARNLSRSAFLTSRSARSSGGRVGIVQDDMLPRGVCVQIAERVTSRYAEKKRSQHAQGGFETPM